MSWLEIKSPVGNGRVSIEIPDAEWGDELAMLLSAAIPLALNECHPEISRARHIVSIGNRFFDSEVDERSKIELYGHLQAQIQSGFGRRPKIVGPVMTVVSVSAIEAAMKKPLILENIPIQAAFIFLHELGELTFRLATGMEIKDSQDPRTRNPFYTQTIPERVADKLALGWLEEATGDKFMRISGGITAKGASEKYRPEKRRERLANLASRYSTSRKK